MLEKLRSSERKHWTVAWRFTTCCCGENTHLAPNYFYILRRI